MSPLISSDSPLYSFQDRTLWDVFAQTARRLPAKVGVVDGERRLTFGELHDLSSVLADGLARQGLGRGDVAAIYMKNCWELVALFYALQRLGVTVAWINPRYREKEASFILQDSGARCVFVVGTWRGFDYVEALRVFADQTPQLETIVAVGPASAGWSDRPEIVPFTRLLESRGCGGAEFPEPTPDDLAMLVYTSGTTGKPKGAMISQGQAVLVGRNYALGVDTRERDVLIGFLPMTHSYGCGVILTQPFLVGARVVLLEDFSPAEALAVIARERVTLQFAAPAHYLLELEELRRESYDLSFLRAGLIAGQIAPTGLIRRVQAEMGIYLASFLGSSETGASIMHPFGATLAQREATIGVPVPDTEIRIVDPVSGVEVGPDQPGELLLKGWHVMQGYWRNREETENQLRDGWLHTGDLVARDRAGYVRVLGRIKECVNRGGFKIIPSELEALLVEHPKIAGVCVVPTPNPVLGESVCACVRLVDRGDSLSLDELRAFLRDRVANFKLPDELLILDEFPMMPGGLKVNRFGPEGVAGVASRARDKQKLHA